MMARALAEIPNARNLAVDAQRTVKSLEFFCCTLGSKGSRRTPLQRKGRILTNPFMVTGPFIFSLDFDGVARKARACGRRGFIDICASHITLFAPHKRSGCLHLKRKVDPMTHSFDDANKFTKEFVDSGLKAFAAVSKSAQAIAIEAGDYSRKAFEAGNDAAERLATARSLENALDIQAEFARSAYEGFVAEAARMVELCADLAKEACKPFESLRA